MLMTYTIEDYLDILLGLHGLNFSIDPLDYKLLHSLHNQIIRNIGLTDKQYQLLKQKLETYKDQYTDHGYHNLDLSSTRLQIRTIDRSKWIKTVMIEDQKKIAVRFTFNKKLIGSLEEIKKRISAGFYDKENKIHYFDYNEKTIYNIIDVFKNKEFEIEEDLLEKYNNLLYMKNNKKEYIPGIYNFKLENLNNHAFDYIVSSLGEPSLENLALYKDRRYQVGLNHFDEQELNQSLQQLTTLSQKIAQRSRRNVYINSDTYQFNRIIESIFELDRFPLMIVIPDVDSLDYLTKCYSALKNIIAEDDSTVLFRKDNQGEGLKFNQFIKDKKLNNTLSDTTKVVYMTDNKIPKPLIKSKWNPNSILLMQSLRFYNKTEAFINQYDLIIHYDNQVSPFIRDSIEEL